VNPPWYYYLKSPLVAHTIGVMIPFGIASIWCSFWGAWAIGVAVVFKGQLQKADALLPSGYNMQNVFYRTLIAVVVPFVVMTI
jgi:hypothetical protein